MSRHNYSDNDKDYKNKDSENESSYSGLDNLKNLHQEKIKNDFNDLNQHRDSKDINDHKDMDGHEENDLNNNDDIEELNVK